MKKKLPKPGRKVPLKEALERTNRKYGKALRRLAEANRDRVRIGPEGSAIVRRIMDPNDPTGKRVRHTPRKTK